MRKRERVTHKNKAKQPDFAVQQAPKNDADINLKLKKHMAGPAKMGIPLGNPMATRRPAFIEMPSASFQDMLNTLVDAKNDFRALPARIKGRFGNDPYQLLRFLEDPSNEAEAIKLGLREAKEPEFVAPAPGSTPPALKADDEAQPSFKGGAPKA